MVIGEVLTILGRWATVQLANGTVPAFLDTKRLGAEFSVQLGDRVLLGPSPIGYLVVWVIPDA